MNAEQIERAERVAARLERRRLNQELVEEKRRWKRPASLATGGKPEHRKPSDDDYVFTSEQFRIAVASLEKRR